MNVLSVRHISIENVSFTEVNGKPYSSKPTILVEGLSGEVVHEYTNNSQKDIDFNHTISSALDKNA